MLKITLLREDQIFGENKLEIFKKRGTKAAITDFAILLGGFVSNNHLNGKDSLNDRTGYYWTKTFYDNDARAVNYNGDRNCEDVSIRVVGCRPAFMFSSIDDLPTNAVIEKTEDGLLSVEYGYFPKWSVSKEMQSRLEFAYENGKLNQKGDGWTTDSRKWYKYDEVFSPIKHIPYEYNGKIYVRVKANLYDENTMLSNGERCETGDYVWVEVEPIRWVASEKDKLMIPEEEILAGLQFNNRRNYSRKFKKTDIYKYLVKFFFKEIISAIDKPCSLIDNKELSEEQKLVNKILGLTQNLKDEEKQIYLEKLEEIKRVYEEGIKCVKPTYKSNNSLSLSPNSLLQVRGNFISSLNLLLLNISFRTSDFSNKVNKSISYLSSLENKDGVFSTVIDMALILDKLDEQSSKLFKDKLLVILNKYSGYTKQDYSKEIQLTLDTDNVERTLEIELSKLLDELNVYIEENFNVISELLNIENIEEEGNSLLREKYLFIKEYGDDVFLERFKVILLEYKNSLCSSDDKVLVIKSFYESLESFIELVKIEIIKNNIKNMENGKEVVKVTNEKLSISLTNYMVIESFIEEMLDYAKEVSKNASFSLKKDIDEFLQLALIECNEVIESDLLVEEQVKKISSICLKFKSSLKSLIDYNEQLMKLDSNTLVRVIKD